MAKWRNLVYAPVLEVGAERLKGSNPFLAIFGG